MDAPEGMSYAEWEASNVSMFRGCTPAASSSHAAPARPLLPRLVAVVSGCDHHARLPDLPRPRSRLQAMHQVKIPRWLEAFLRIPGAAIILLLILFPLTLVSGSVSVQKGGPCGRARGLGVSKAPSMRTLTASWRGSVPASSGRAWSLHVPPSTP